jgi:alkylation response protein AidB-like acyl-CoA dehydrogenase
MISFELTDEQKQLRDMTHKFAENEIRPKAAEYDKTETFPQDIMEKAFELRKRFLRISWRKLSNSAS